MELKRRIEIVIHIINISSNRTFMELKLAREHNANAEGKVLIVPLWN